MNQNMMYQPGMGHDAYYHGANPNYGYDMSQMGQYSAYANQAQPSGTSSSKYDQDVEEFLRKTTASSASAAQTSSAPPVNPDGKPKEGDRSSRDRSKERGDHHRHGHRRRSSSHERSKRRSRERR